MENQRSIGPNQDSDNMEERLQQFSVKDLYCMIDSLKDSQKHVAENLMAQQVSRFHTSNVCLSASNGQSDQDFFQ